jgi:hypothetical protein
MENDTLKNYIKALDPELKVFIQKEEWRKKLRKICSDYGVKDEELITGIENETLIIIIGISYVGDFQTNLEQIGLPKIQAGPVSEAIAKDILFDVAEYLSPQITETTESLPDASVGLISDKEVVIKNPIQIKPQTVQINTAQTPKAPSVPQSAPVKISSVPNTQMSWEERKKKAEEALKNIVPAEIKKYPGGADPYREAIQ